MHRVSRPRPAVAQAALLVAGLLALTACGSTSGTASSTPPVSSTAPLSVLITDSPSDDWQQVSVQLLSVSLRNQADKSWVQVWAPESGATPPTVNLVDLNGVAQFLNQITIPTGAYDRVQLTINTDPATMTLVGDDGNTIDAANIMVVDPSHKGQITIDLSPAIQVAAGQANVLQVDFDLAHPLSIVEQSGKVILNLQLRCKAVPRSLADIQFARTIGQVKQVAADGTSLVVTTDQGVDVTFGANANTIVVNVDDTSATPAVKDIPAGVYALVASNMNADGTLYARRIWFSTDEAKLPKYSPEGIVRRIGPNWIQVLDKNAGSQHGRVPRWLWNPNLVYVDANTTWTFQTSVAMGTGTSVLPYIRRGFRVSVEYVDANASPKVAKSINVQSAHDEGAIRSATTTSFAFGGFGYCHGWAFGLTPNMAAVCSHEWTYSTVADHAFSWWFYGLPSGSSANVQDFVDTVAQAKTAGLRVFARAELYWDTTNNMWAAENVILAPEKIPGPAKVTTGYTAASGTMGVSTFSWDDDATPAEMTVALDQAGDLQTVVGSFAWNSTTRVITFTVPVTPDQWEALLTPALQGVKVWVRPEKTTATDGTVTWTWHAYTVLAYQVTD